MREIFVCRESELIEGATRIVTEGDREIAVINHAGAIVAYRNHCPHQGGPACEGVRMPRVRELTDAGGASLGQTFDEDEMLIICPWHGYSFRLSDGQNPIDPNLRLKKHEVARRDGGIYVRL